MAAWSALPSDTLGLISERLVSPIDYILFRSVCSPWRSAVPRRPQLPWLVGQCLDDGGHYTVFNFLTLSSNGQLASLPLPEASIGALCRGSSHGWLALLDRTPSITLFNPITSSRIQLPPITDFPSYLGTTYTKVGDVYFCKTQEGAAGTVSFNEMQTYLAKKIILSSDPSGTSNCVVMALCCNPRRLAFCRPGNDAWTTMQSPHIPGYSVDVAFYRGRFYVAGRYTVYVCGVGADAKVERMSMAAARFDEEPTLYEVHECYLVECSGDLLLINMCYYDWREGYKVEIFKLDWSGQRLRLVKLKSLSDRAVFLGRNQSFSLPAAQFPGCEWNCIYMAEYDQVNRSAVRVIHLEDGRNEFLSNGSNPYSKWQPCAWLKPSML